MSDLVEFLRARLDEDEDQARSCAGPHWCGCRHVNFVMTAGDCDCGYPARVLAEVEAKRKIIEGHPINRAEVKEPGKPTYGCETCHYHSEYGVLGSGECDTLRLLALPYADHEDYREEWRP